MKLGYIPLMGRNEGGRAGEVSHGSAASGLKLLVVKSNFNSLESLALDKG